MSAVDAWISRPKSRLLVEMDAGRCFQVVSSAQKTHAYQVNNAEPNAKIKTAKNVKDIELYPLSGISVNCYLLS